MKLLLKLKLKLIPGPVSIVYRKISLSTKNLETQEAFNTSDNFSFHEVREDEFWWEILRLDGTKSTPVGYIPDGLLKSTIDIYTSIITKIINLSLRNGCFSDDLKVADVSPIFKKILK